MKENKLKVVSSLLTIIVLVGLIGIIVANYTTAPYVTNIEISDSKRFEDKVIFNVEIGNFALKFDKSTWW